MTAALEGHEGTVSIAGRATTRLRFADHIGSFAGEKEELANYLSIATKPTAFHMEISAEKKKMMINNTSGINKEIKVNGLKLEILSRIAETTAELTRLKHVWNYGSISLSSKIRRMRSLVTSLFLYACESQQSCKEEYEPWK